MTYETAKKILTENNQAHVLAFWDKITPPQQKKLLDQIATLDFTAIGRMQQMLAEKSNAPAPAADFTPAPVEVLEGNARKEAFTAGEELIRAGKVGILVVAGGQGSRLGFEGPKGCYPIGPVTNKTLFYFHTRKIAALARQYRVSIPFYIMTSDTNDAATRHHFAENNYFGMNPDDVFFFIQGMWPALTDDGKIILDAPDHIFMSPDGHGGTLSALDASGALADMKRRGIDYIFFFQVDNPLINIAAPAFIGLHHKKGAEVSVKVCKKRDANEGVGNVVLRSGRYAMVEYTELTPEQKNQRKPDGTLYFSHGSVAIHIFNRAFLEKEAAGNLPLHIAHKKIPYCTPDGRIVKPDTNNGYKFEKFIFDVLPDASIVMNQEFERNEEFSPVKNAEGDDSPATTKRDMQLKWARWFAAAGIEIPLRDGAPAIPLEIDPCYAWNADLFRERGINLTTGK